jgi:hypothetical protein
MAGFIDTQVTTSNDTSEVLCSKPDYEVGAVSTLRKQPAAATATTGAVWKLNADDDDDDDLIDEDSLVAGYVAKSKQQGLFVLVCVCVCVCVCVVRF